MKDIKFSRLVAILVFGAVLVGCGSAKKAPAEVMSPKKAPAAFEGKIIYDMIVRDKSGEMSDDETLMMMGDSMVFTIKGGKYKGVMNGMMKSTQIYLGQDTLYQQMAVMNGLFAINVAKNPDSLISFEIRENAEVVNGIDCHVLSIVATDGTHDFYYNPEYTANPADFARHEYGFWKFAVEKTGCLPLKSIDDDPELYLELTAIDILPMTIDDSEFALPEGPRMPSPE